MEGLIFYSVYFLSMAGIYAVMALGLNVQWGLTGQINIGIGGFFGIGAYTSALLTVPATQAHLGGAGLPFLVGIAGAVLAAVLVAAVVGLITVKLRTDYLAIATIGIAEIIRLVLKNETWLTGGVRGLPAIPKPFPEGALGVDPRVLFFGVILVFLALTYALVERARNAPWGRVLRAIRDSEPAVAASGKSVMAFRLQAFVVGSAFMGLGGALYAHFTGFLSPAAIQPVFGTFIVWAMLIAGGSGNNKGAILGAVAIWAVWSGSEFVIGSTALGQVLPEPAAWRVLLVGVLIEAILLFRPQGLLPETAPRPVDKPGEGS